MDMSSEQQSTQTLRAALVGCGRIGSSTSEHVRRTVPAGWLPLSHADAILANRGMQLAALCDLNENNLARACRDYGVDSCYTDYRDMIDTQQPEIVCVATRTAGRADIIEYAARHGVRGVHVEKPLSRNMLDSRRALDAASEHEMPVSYGTTRRYMDTYRRAQEMIEAGDIGDLVAITVAHGRTMLMWNHPHSVDLLLFYSNCTSAAYVQASCDTHGAVLEGGVLDCDPIVENAFVRFENGINGVITSAAGMNTHLSGTRGTIVVGADGTWIELHQKIDDVSPYHQPVSRSVPEPKMSGTQRAFAELGLALRRGQKLSIRSDEILEGQRILLAIAYSSLRGGARIAPTDVEDSFTVTGRTGDLHA